METKNMINLRNKKGETILNIMIMAILGVFFFGAMLSFTTQNANEAGISVPARYNDSYQQLLTTQDNLSETTEDIRDAISGLTEETNPVGFVLNGIKGLLALFQLPLKILAPIRLGLSIVLDMLDFIPRTLIVTITIIITIIIVFAILKFVTQRGNDA